ncbi:glycosyltransferase family 2 protein [Sphingomonas sp. ID1715]|uniref:glycosyltransferase family 2 protein n=1 Tax=Sphingomonas sp. ID1715 TaxID=1656898 RepID=UPI001489C9B5|nr:glycosyltransferase family 2 protein [Sphingomonas sp. ID1715]NNM77243.1 glycosyltransferase family 2 protein [Sphingomonas sp. ID1715]
MRLTVAVPTYRRPDMLRECLDSLVPQLVGGVELLVVDNDPAASARETVASYGRADVRYAHEPKPGVVQARNRAVGESAGAYLGFIDDDEVARPGWIAALLRHAERGVTASFGMVVPRYLGDLPPGLKPLLDDLYTRDLERPADADISDRWIHVGTGNSLFCKAACFVEAAPFSAELNGTGGEDVWLVRSLVERGLKLHWNPEAVVEEQIPADRSTLAYVSSRKFRHGQQRIIMMRGAGGPKGWAKAAAWMGVGGVQYALHGGRAVALRALGKPGWRSEAVRASGGLGKMLWWKLWEQTPYAGSAS